MRCPGPHRPETPRSILRLLCESPAFLMRPRQENQSSIRMGFFGCCRETIRKTTRLHQWDVLRANKAPFAWGLEPRVPFLDKAFLDITMALDPELKMVCFFMKNASALVDPSHCKPCQGSCMYTCTTCLDTTLHLPDAGNRVQYMLKDRLTCKGDFSFHGTPLENQIGICLAM